jgi:hypothetical protein
LPNTLRAKSVGSLALRALSRAGSTVAGTVVNTFANSFYVRTGKDELLFFTNLPIRSPITVNLDGRYAKSDLEKLVTPLQSLTVEGKQILIGTDTTITLDAALLYDDTTEQSSELNLDFSMISKSLRIVSVILKIIDTSQSVLDPHAIAHNSVVEFASDAVKSLLRPGGEERFRQVALRIVGLGSGFTPSGDDTLGGFLAVYNSFANAIGRAPILLDLHAIEERTSWISAKLLDHMQHLILDEQVRGLTDSVTDEDELVLAFESLLPRGHTSGIDISVGAILALDLIHDISLDDRHTGIIADELGLSS